MIFQTFLLNPFQRICHPPKMNIRIYYPQKNLRSTGGGSEMIRFTFLLPMLFIIGSICFWQRYIFFSILPNERCVISFRSRQVFRPTWLSPTWWWGCGNLSVQLSLKQIISVLSYFDYRCQCSALIILQHTHLFHGQHLFYMNKSTSDHKSKKQ